jgi:aminomethyltransferase
MLDSYPRVIPGPPRPSRIMTPASLTRHSGRERYEVPGAGALLIPLGTGDSVTLANTEGGQVCELVAADARGRIDAAILGVPANGDGSALTGISGTVQSMRAERFAATVAHSFGFHP